MPDGYEWRRPAADGLGHLTHRDFDRLADFIQAYSGIKMPPSKVTMLEGRLRRRVRETGMADLHSYCDYLFDRGGLDNEAVALIDAVTTNKTEFFREPEHFNFLAQHALPALLHGGSAHRRHGVKLWSAACSTGAESYTLAMVVAEAARDIPGLRYTILGTDLSTAVLRVATNAIYPEAAVLPVPLELRRRYLLRSRDRSRQQVRIVPALRAVQRFVRMNLMAPEYPVDRDFDVLFCRNALIYFDKRTQQQVLQRLCQHLRSGGYLFLGHSESIAGMTLPVTPVGGTVFRKV